jgi:hypothetical protein
VSVSDAVHVANLLMRDAQDFEREARYWGDYARMSAPCAQAAELLTTAARHVLRTGDETWGESWHRAAVLTLNQVQLVRLFRDGNVWAPTVRT